MVEWKAQGRRKIFINILFVDKQMVVDGIKTTHHEYSV